jgi:dTDP-glucose 4,6-dehydratase
VRDWLFVDDHVKALLLVVQKGTVGETYNIGGNSQRKNIDVVRGICSVLDRLRPRANSAPYEALITYVPDRPGHDYRYAISTEKIQSHLRWSPTVTFEAGLEKTVQWYLQNRAWCEEVSKGKYERERLGKI